MSLFAGHRTRTAALLLFWLAFCGWAVWGWASLAVMRGPSGERLSVADGYEIRSYRTALAAQVQVSGPWAQVTERADRLLRAYASEAGGFGLFPLVHEQRGDGSWLVSYLLSSRFTDATAPRPDDPQVRMVTLPARTAAVVRFSGGPDAASAAEEQLRSRLARDRILVTGVPRIVRYDAPLVPPFMRRNELIIPILP